MGGGVELGDGVAVDGAPPRGHRVDDLARLAVAVAQAQPDAVRRVHEVRVLGRQRGGVGVPHVGAVERQQRLGVRRCRWSRGARASPPILSARLAVSAEVVARAATSALTAEEAGGQAAVRAPSTSRARRVTSERSSASRACVGQAAVDERLERRADAHGVLDDVGAGDLEHLDAVLTGPLGGARGTGRRDDGGRLAGDRRRAARAGGPVDGVLHGARERAVVLGGDEEHRVGVGDGLTQVAGDLGQLVVVVEVLGVVREARRGGRTPCPRPRWGGGRWRRRRAAGSWSRRAGCRRGRGRSRVLLEGSGGGSVQGDRR